MMNPTASLPVVVGVDGSTSAIRAVHWASREAARRRTRLLIVHSDVLVTVQPAELYTSYVDAVVDQSRQWLAAAAAVAGETAPQVEVNTELSTGSAAERLIERSASAQLVVLGSRGLGGFTGLLVGSIAVSVSTHGHCPVVVVRGPHPDTEPTQDAPVVVGVDGSRTSDAAIAFAFEEAALRGAPVHAVHTWMDLTVATGWAGELMALNWESIEAEQRRLLSRQLADSRKTHPDVPVREILARDRPAHTLLKHAETAQLVVVGSRGRGGFRGLLLGSTSQALIHHAACPVAVVPPPQR